MRLRLTYSFACAALALLAFPVQASPNGHVRDHFNSSLAGLPHAVFEGKEWGSFVNLHAVEVISAEQKVPLSASRRWSLGAEWPVLQFLATTSAERFTEVTGLPSYELLFVAEYGQGPQKTLLWGIEKDARKLLAGAWPRLGFTEEIPKNASENASIEKSWSNGVLGEFNLEALKSPTPWRWPDGSASLVKQVDAWLYQSQSEAAMQAATQQPSAAETTAGQILAELYGHRRGHDFVVQALFCSQAVGEDLGGRTHDGQPPYLGGMLADIEGEGGARAELVYAYADCTQAIQGKDALERLWQAQTPAKPQFSITESIHGCAAVVTVQDPQPSIARNQAFYALHAAMLTRNLVPLLAK